MQIDNIHKLINTIKEENIKLTEELKTKTDMLLRSLEEKKTAEEQVNKLKNFLNEDQIAALNNTRTREWSPEAVIKG